MKFVLHKDGVQLLPETQLDVEILEGWQTKKFQANDMAVMAGKAGVQRYYQGLLIILSKEVI